MTFKHSWWPSIHTDVCILRHIFNEANFQIDLHYQTYSSNLEHILLFPFTPASAPPVIVIIRLFQDDYRLIEKTLEQEQKFTLGLH